MMTTLFSASPHLCVRLPLPLLPNLRSIPFIPFIPVEHAAVRRIVPFFDPHQIDPGFKMLNRGVMAKAKLATSDPNAIQQDTDKLVRFLSMFCEAHHGHRLREPFIFEHTKVPAKVSAGPELCDECKRLLRHAIVMRVHCPLDPKPKCRNCPQHCYRPAYKDQMEKVMKYAGPRSLLKRH